MAFPGFFSDVAPIVMHDRLAEFLGATDSGIIEYRYADAVKLAGHSCPAVAGAYLLTGRALAALYPDELPERGEIQGRLRCSPGQRRRRRDRRGGRPDHRRNRDGGFKGIAGHFSRRNLLGFEEAGLMGEIRFTRRDNGWRLGATLHLEQVPADPRLAPLLQRLLAGERDPAVAKLFAYLWQQRVQQILIDHADNEALVSLLPDPN